MIEYIKKVPVSNTLAYVAENGVNERDEMQTTCEGYRVWCFEVKPEKYNISLECKALYP